MHSLETFINTDILAFHVGQAIFCPTCQQVLDVRRAVSVDFKDASGQLMSTRVMCVACWVRNEEKVRLLAAGKGYSVDVLDGRVLYPTPVKTPKTTPTFTTAIKAKDVEIGKRYEISHTSGYVIVRVVGFKGKTIHSNGYGAPAMGVKRQYRCINEKTGRDIIVKSAAKFRREVQ